MCIYKTTMDILRAWESLIMVNQVYFISYVHGIFPTQDGDLVSVFFNGYGVRSYILMSGGEIITSFTGIDIFYDWLDELKQGE